MSDYRKKLIEVAMPLEAINKESAREKSIRHGHPSTLHLWWARRPLASCRAVLFGQMVDDPSSWPERFPTEEEQDAERQRLFGIIEELVIWENSNNESVLNAARKEIAQSLARNRVDTDEGTERDDEVLAEDVTSEIIGAYLAEVAPPVHDPFAGGGAIPLEAQRLGFRAIATDLNPVAVLINKAMIEIPPKFAGKAPVHPDAEQRTNWNGAEGLAEDVRRYGEWMRDEAKKRIDHLYPEVDLPEEHGGGKATVIAWLWARTVESPDPAFKGVHVPLVSNFFLSTKKDKEAWVEPVIEGRDYRFEIRTGKPEDPAIIKKGTKLSRGANFRCLMSGSPIGSDYIKQEGVEGRLKSRLMAIVAEGNRKRLYLPPTKNQEDISSSAEPTWAPQGELPANRQYSNPPLYGICQWGDLFSPRQLVALTTFSSLVLEARDKVIADARAAGWEDDEKGIEDGGCGATAYGDAISLYLSFVVDKCTDYWSNLCSWHSSREIIRNTFGRQALPMVWDYAECNPYCASTGNWMAMVNWVWKVIDKLPANISGRAVQLPAQEINADNDVQFSTDPPYFDNVPYADISDFFYVWLRRSVGAVFPQIFSTVMVPKSEELVANHLRQGGKAESRRFFLDGMTIVMTKIAENSSHQTPTTIFYAFKQEEVTLDGTSSTGWDAFLEGVLKSGFSVVSTIPFRTELANRMRGNASNALASSVVLTCRRRVAGAISITRGDFQRLLRRELPAAITNLRKGNIAPVDMAQASIGPGMAIFSRHSKVVEADGSDMSVRTALQMINEMADELRGEEESDLDRETRFAVTWFETHGFESGPFGEAEVLATARAVSVETVQDSGLLKSGAGKTRLLMRAELPGDWDPTTDTTLTVWECTQHLIKRLEEQGESAAADLLHKMGPRAEAARTLAYRLYTHCERTGNAEEARAYNGLVVAWPELQKLISSGSTQQLNRVEEVDLFTTGEER